MSDVIKWQDSPVNVQARLVPRFLWTTASIDVFLGEQCILRTGGQVKFTGSQSARFTHSGSSHTAELSWGANGSSFSFPYQLRIDGVLVSTSRVSIRNRRVRWIAVIVVVVLALALHFVRRALQP